MNANNSSEVVFMLRYIKSENGLHHVSETETGAVSIYTDTELMNIFKEDGTVAGLFLDADSNIWSVMGVKLVDVGDLKAEEAEAPAAEPAPAVETVPAEEPVVETAFVSEPVVEAPAMYEDHTSEPIVTEQSVDTEIAVDETSAVDELSDEDKAMFADLGDEPEQEEQSTEPTPAYQFRYRGMKDGLHRVEDLSDGVIDTCDDLELRQAYNAFGGIEGLILYDDGSIWDDFGVLRVAGPKATTRNSNLASAKRAKNDEFYTQLCDIEKELSYYPEDTFKDKVIYCPTDVAVNTGAIMQSQFVKYFQMNAHRLQFKKLIATCLVEKAAGEGEDIEQVQNCYVLERVTVPMLQRNIYGYTHGMGSSNPVVREVDDFGIKYETQNGQKHAVPYHIVNQAVTESDGRIVIVKKYIDHFDETDGHVVVGDEYVGRDWYLDGHKLTIKWCRMHPDGTIEVLPNECYFFNNDDIVSDFGVFPKDKDGNPCFESVEGGSVCLYPPEYYDFCESEYEEYSWHCPADERWGSGDFRSEYCTKLLEESDIVVTNPPFSIFRSFWDWLIKSKKCFIVISSMNAITYKEVFPFIEANKVWCGCKSFGGGMNMIYPRNMFDPSKVKKYKLDDKGNYLVNIQGVIWFTNVEHIKRHERIVGLSKADNEARGVVYTKYDNYDALNVDKVDQIPMDYTGVMGVPITFLGRYCPEQFEIIWQASGNTRASAPKDVLEFLQYNQLDNDRGGACVVNGKLMYNRIFIRKRDYTVEHNSDMAHCDEFRAKLILEDDSVCGLKGLRKCESPDWVSDCVGVEVTTAYDKLHNIVNGLYERDCIDRLNGTSPRDMRSLMGSHTVVGSDNSVMSAEFALIRDENASFKVGITHGDLYSPQKTLLFKAIDAKLKKLNSDRYCDIDTWLFIFSHIDLGGDSASCLKKDKLLDLLNEVSRYQKSVIIENFGWRGFSVVCVYSESDAILYKLDVENEEATEYVIDESKYSDVLKGLSRRFNRHI